MLREILAISMRHNYSSCSQISFTEGITKSPGIPPGTQALSSGLFSSPLDAASRSITHKANIMTSTLTWSLTPRTPQETLRRHQTTKKEAVIIRVEKQEPETATTISKKHRIEAGSYDHYSAEEEANVSVSYTEDSKAGDKGEVEGENETLITRNFKENLQEILEAELGPVLFNANETWPAGHPQTPESVSSSQHIEEAKSSEDGDEEETEVSTEMAQISYAPVSAWEENETVIPEERSIVSELELESEDTRAESDTPVLGIDADHEELQLLGENINYPTSLLLQEIPQLSEGTISPAEDDSEILTWADVKEDVIHFVEEDSIKSAPEVDTEKDKGTEEVEANLEVEQAEWPGTAALEDKALDIQVQNVKQCKEEELTDVKEERMIEEYSFGGEKAEFEMGTYEKDTLVGEKAEAVIGTFDKDQLVEHNAEEEKGQSEDESLNISASWRTDPGEADSYAQENTLADTRPLIHYKCEEESDANIPVSHLGVSESTDGEEEKVKHEGESHWSQIIAKRFDTMEDLSEEPELGSMDDLATDGSGQTVLRESMDQESIIENKSGDTENQNKMLLDDALVDQPERDLRNNSNENRQGDEESKIENYHLSALLGEKQEPSSQFHDWSESLFNKSREINEQQTFSTMQANINKDEFKYNTENCNIESTEIYPEGEDEKFSDSSLPEPSQEQIIAEELCEDVSPEITHSDVLLFETAITEEQACSKEDDVQSNLSMLTHADFTDEFSLHSHPESQTNTNDSDLEDPNSSEDESPNASQCSQLPPRSEMQIDQDSVTTVDVVQDTEPHFTDILPGILGEERSEDAPQAEELENKEEQQHAVDSNSGLIGENAYRLNQECENMRHESTSASHSIFSTAEEFGDVEMDNNKENTDIQQGDAVKEECQTDEKENDHHSFFSSSIKEDIWSTTKFEMAATYKPHDQTEAERYTNDSINPNQDWENLERLPRTSNKPEKDLGTSITQSMVEKGEEQKMPQAKQEHCRDVKDGEEETVHAEESTDEGDSWSSGEE